VTLPIDTFCSGVRNPALTPVVFAQPAIAISICILSTTFFLLISLVNKCPSCLDTIRSDSAHDIARLFSLKAQLA
jgi:hypothetical protein